MIKIIIQVILLVTLNIYSQTDSLYRVYQDELDKYNYGKCEQIINTIIKKDSTSKYAIAKADLYSKLGKFTASNQILYNIKMADDNKFLIKLKIADNFFSNGNYDRALIYYSNITDTSSGYYLLQKCGDCNYMLNNFVIADSFYNQAYLINKEPRLIIKLAKTKTAIGRTDVALQVIEDGIKLYPDNMQLLKYGVEINFNKGEYITVINHVLKSESLGDTSFNNFVKAGISYYYIAGENVSRETNQKYNEAVTYLKKAIEKESGEPLVWYYLGLSYQGTDSLENALEAFNTAEELFYPSYTDDLYFRTGKVYEQLGQNTAAIKYYVKAKNKNPGRSVILFYLANLYDKYYSDPTVAFNNYSLFTKRFPEADSSLLEYANNRIEDLRERIHFYK